MDCVNLELSSLMEEFIVRLLESSCPTLYLLPIILSVLGSVGRLGLPTSSAYVLFLIWSSLFFYCFCSWEGC